MMVRLLTSVLVVLGVILAGWSVSAHAATSGGAWAWGDNADGELGNGTITRYGGIAAPGHVHGLSGVTAVTGGSDFSLALKTDGTVWAWGNGGWGQLGQGIYTSSNVPLQVPSISSVRAIAAGYLHSLALKSDGTVWAWGFNYYGQVGNGTSGNNVLSPSRVGGLSGIVAIKAGTGSDTSYALRSDGTVWAWGYDGLGQLGIGTSNESAHPMPIKVSNLTRVTAIGGGSDHALAVREDGTVWAWGSNQNSQLGAKTSTTCSVYQDPCSPIPIQVPTLSGVTAVAGGGDFSLALKGDGTVWGWGDNGYGQLGIGTTTSSGGVATPTRAHLSSVRAIAAGDNHTLALRSDGTVWGAGSNEWGQLGNGTFTNSSTPVRTSGLTGITAIGAGLDHSLAVSP